jgi:hypothetical protein
MGAGGLRPPHRLTSPVDQGGKISDGGPYSRLVTRERVFERSDGESHDEHSEPDGHVESHRPALFAQMLRLHVIGAESSVIARSWHAAGWSPRRRSPVRRLKGHWLRLSQADQVAIA